MYLFGALIILVFALAFLVTGIKVVSERKHAFSGRHSDQLTLTGVGCFILFFLSLVVFASMVFN